MNIQWSSHKGYISKTKKREWLHKAYILDLFSKDKSLQITEYNRFVSKEESGVFIQHYSIKNLPSMLGSEKFINWIKVRFPKKEKSKEIPASNRLCPEVRDIKREICKHYQIAEPDLLKSRRGVENEARDLAIYMVRVIRGECLTSIGSEFNLNNYSSVSAALDRIRKQLGSKKSKKHYVQISKLLLR